MRHVRFALMLLLLLAVLPLTTLAQGPDDLTQTYTTDDGTLTFDYPDGWKAVPLEDTGLVVVGSDPDPIELFMNASNLEDDVMAVVFTPALVNETVLSRVTLITDPPLMDVAQAAVNVMQMEDTIGMMDFGAVTELPLESKPAMLATSTSEFFDVVTIVLELAPGEYAIINAMTAPGNLETYQPVLVAIADSVRAGATEPEIPVYLGYMGGGSGEFFIGEEPDLMLSCAEFVATAADGEGVPVYVIFQGEDMQELDPDEYVVIDVPYDSVVDGDIQNVYWVFRLEDVAYCLDQSPAGQALGGTLVFHNDTACGPAQMTVTNLTTGDTADLTVPQAETGEVELAAEYEYEYVVSFPEASDGPTCSEQSGSLGYISGGMTVEFGFGGN
ncbi:MAG: hypothetical protein GYB65_15425 [Chloroflexi bacterium]|nr:hypothetical protein [Chloroflexota bacterium]